MARILVLIPHPDDEVVGVAATVARRHAAGDVFFGLYLTTGVPATEQIWRWDRAKHEERVRCRRDEARTAAALLGIEPVGFSDWPSRTLKSHLAEAAIWIGRLLTEYAIDAIWVAAWEGGHQDHDAANFLASRAAAGRPVYEFAEYNSSGGINWNCFATGADGETVHRLTAAEVQAKRRLLAVYETEKKNLSRTDIAIESLRPLPNHDYGRPPHAGKLFRERYHWVRWFFRHPRVDFEPSADVYAALRAFKAWRPDPAP